MVSLCVCCGLLLLIVVAGCCYQAVISQSSVIARGLLETIGEELVCCASVDSYWTAFADDPFTRLLLRKFVFAALVCSTHKHWAVLVKKKEKKKVDKKMND